jgi:hypothetical protein
VTGKSWWRGGREEFNKEKKKLLKAELEMQLEVLDGLPPHHPGAVTGVTLFWFR